MSSCINSSHPTSSAVEDEGGANTSRPGGLLATPRKLSQPETPIHPSGDGSPQATQLSTCGSAEGIPTVNEGSIEKAPDEALDVAYVQRLLAAGDVAGAELALKKLKKTIKGERKHQKEKSKNEKRTSTEDAATVVSADEHKCRRAIEKECKRECDVIEKTSKESYKSHLELEGRRMREEKKERDRVEKDRRDVERSEVEGRREVAKNEKHDRETIERERKTIEKIERELRRDAERIAKEAKQHELRKPTVPPAKSLISFGFSAEKRKFHEGDNSLFTPFVQDRRIVPRRLQFWHDRNDQTARVLETGEEGTPATKIHSAMFTRCAVPEGFCTEVIFTGFSAIGFEPAQARPSYWGTSNPILNDSELECIARHSLHTPIPRLSTLNYEYDSGDDWDHMDSDDDDVDASDDEEGESDDSESCNSFIDDNSCSDSDGEEVSRFISARTRRQNRLRGKDRLVPSFSGPFDGNAGEKHPLRTMDELTILVQVDQSAVQALLAQELEKTSSAGMLPAAKSTVQRYRPMGEHEIEEMKLLIQENPIISKSLLCEVLTKRPSFAGVPSSEVRRTLKRYFEHSKGSFIERPEAWNTCDPRLMEKKAPRKRDRPSGEELDRQNGVCDPVDESTNAVNDCPAHVAATADNTSTS